MENEIYYDSADSVHCITYKGQTKTLSGWAKHFGIGREVLANRLRRGWNWERAINRPVKKRHRKKKVDQDATE